MLRIALLHLRPRPAALAANRARVEAALSRAAAAGADWVVTPELCTTGYQFAGSLGADWIRAPDDPWLARMQALVARLGVTLFLALPAREVGGARRYNSAFVIGPDGAVLGVHRKLVVVPGSESWSSPGDAARPIDTHPLRAGVLICADAWPPDHAAALAAAGARILISPASWAPKPHGPDGCWAARTRETGLPLFVCNRTGPEETLDFSDSETGVYVDGAAAVVHASPDPAAVVVDWDLAAGAVAGSGVIPLS